MKRSFRTLLLSLPLVLAGTAFAFDLTVEVLNPKALEGSINAAVYGSAEGWLKDGQAVGSQRAAVAEKTVLVYRGLAAGPHAVSVFHDENGNGKLDRNVVGMPLERYGFSRDARVSMGPPAFADAAVDLQADTTISITLK